MKIISVNNIHCAVRIDVDDVSLGGQVCLYAHRSQAGHPTKYAVIAEAKYARL